MPETCTGIDESLFLDEPLDVPKKRVVRDHSDLDALLAFEAEAPREPFRAGPSTVLFAESPCAPERARTPLLISLALIGVAAGFALMLMLLR